MPLFWQSGCCDRKFKYLHEYVDLWCQSKYSLLLSDIIIISRKLRDLLFSTSSVNCNLGLNELKIVSIFGKIGRTRDDYIIHISKIEW